MPYRLPSEFAEDLWPPGLRSYPGAGVSLGGAICLGVGLAIALGGFWVQAGIALGLSALLLRRSRRDPDLTHERRWWLIALEIFCAAGVFAWGAVELLRLFPPPVRVLDFAAPPWPAAVSLIAALALVNAILEEWLWRVLIYGVVVAGGVPPFLGGWCFLL